MDVSFKKLYNEAISIEDARKMGLRRDNGGAYKIDKLNKIFKGKDRIVLPIKVNDKEIIKDSPLNNDDTFLKHIETLNIFFTKYNSLKKSIYTGYQKSTNVEEDYSYIDGYDEYKKHVYAYVNGDKYYDDFGTVAELTPMKINSANMTKYSNNQFNREIIQRLMEYMVDIKPYQPNYMIHSVI